MENRAILGFGGMNDTLSDRLLPEDKSVLIEDCYTDKDGLLHPAPERKMIADFIHGRFKNVWFMTAWDRGDDTIIIWSEQPDESTENLPVYYCSLNDYLQNGADVAIRRGKTNNGTPFFFNRLNAIHCSAQTNDIIFFFNVYFDIQRKRVRDISFDGNSFSVSNNSSICGTFYRDRLVLVEHGDRNVVKWSLPNEFGNFATEDWVSVEPFDNDVINALIPYLNSVVVFKGRHIYRIVDLPPSQIRTISTKHGCLSPQSICVWQNYLYFINQYGHLCVTGGGDEDIKELTPSELQNEVEKHQSEIINNTLANKKYTYLPPWNKGDERKLIIKTETPYIFDNNGTLKFVLSKDIIRVRSEGEVSNTGIMQVPQIAWQGLMAVNLPITPTNPPPYFKGRYCESITIPIYCESPQNIRNVNIRAVIVRGDGTLKLPSNDGIYYFPVNKETLNNHLRSFIRDTINNAGSVSGSEVSVNIGTNQLCYCSFNYFPTPPSRPTIDDLGNNPPALTSTFPNYWLLLWAEDENGNLFVNDDLQSDVVFKFFGGKIANDESAVQAPVVSVLRIAISSSKDRASLFTAPLQMPLGDPLLVVLHSDGGLWDFPKLKFWSYRGGYIDFSINHRAGVMGSSIEKIEFDFTPFRDKDIGNRLYLQNHSRGLTFFVNNSKILDVPPITMNANDDIEWGTYISFNTLYAPQISSARVTSIGSVFSGSENPTLVSTQRALYIFLPESGDTDGVYRYIRYDGKNFSVFRDASRVSPVSAFSIQDAIVCYIGQNTGKLVLFSEIAESQKKIKSLPLHITSYPKVITRNAPLLPLTPQVGLIRRVVIGANQANPKSTVKITLKSDTDSSVNYEFRMDSEQKVIGLPVMLGRYIQAEIQLRAFDQLQGLYPIVIEWLPQRAGNVYDNIQELIREE